MDVAFQYEGMHPLDREWIVILPIVQLALFSTVWMFPRSLRHGVRYPEWALYVLHSPLPGFCCGTDIRSQVWRIHLLRLYHYFLLALCSHDNSRGLCGVWVVGCGIVIRLVSTMLPQGYQANVMDKRDT